MILWSIRLVLEDHLKSALMMAGFAATTVSLLEQWRSILSSSISIEPETETFINTAAEAIHHL